MDGGGVCVGGGRRRYETAVAVAALVVVTEQATETEAVCAALPREKARACAQLRQLRWGGQAGARSWWDR